MGKGRDKRKRKQKKIARKEQLRGEIPPKAPVKTAQPASPPPDKT